MFCKGVGMNYTNEKILVCENSRILIFLVIISVIYLRILLELLKAILS